MVTVVNASGITPEKAILIIFVMALLCILLGILLAIAVNNSSDDRTNVSEYSRGDSDETNRC